MNEEAPIGRRLKVESMAAHSSTGIEYIAEQFVLGDKPAGATGTKGEMERSLYTLMDEVEGRNESNVIQMVALRDMMKAKYSVHNIGHFGLAFDYYTHFTSPIRRYPDTIVHRLLTKYQNGGRSVNKDHCEELCEHCSDMEQVAQNAERDSIKYKMVEFMADKVGQEYDAHISGIQSYGVYCEIDENHCEGMVLIRDLDDDYYDFDERNYCLVGRRHHYKYQLGDAIRIKVARANLQRRQLDFVLADDGTKKESDQPEVTLETKRKDKGNKGKKGSGGYRGKGKGGKKESKGKKE